MGSIPPCEHFEHYNCWPGVDHYTISSLDQGCLGPPIFVYLMRLYGFLQ